MLSIVLC